MGRLEKAWQGARLILAQILLDNVGQIRGLGFPDHVTGSRTAGEHLRKEQHHKDQGEAAMLFHVASIRFFDMRNGGGAAYVKIDCTRD